MTDSFSRLMRMSCDECGSNKLDWSNAAQLLGVVGFQYRARVRELIGFVGVDADAWFCSRCGAFGAFGPLLFG